MISRKQHMSAAIAYALSDFGRTTLFVVPALLFVSLRAVFIGAVIFAARAPGDRCCRCAAAVRREFRPTWRSGARSSATRCRSRWPSASSHPHQLPPVRRRRPLRPADVRHLLNRPAEHPLVDLIMTSTTSVMMVKMAEDPSTAIEALGLFHDTVSRLAFLIAARARSGGPRAPFIVTLYTTSTGQRSDLHGVGADDHPAIFAVDAMLRVYAQTRFLAHHEPGATRVCCRIDRLVPRSVRPGRRSARDPCGGVRRQGLGVIRIARLLQVPVSNVLPRAALARITARAAAAARYLRGWWHGCSSRCRLSPW
jgi:hypothetical protein